MAMRVSDVDAAMRFTFDSDAAGRYAALMFGTAQPPRRRTRPRLRPWGPRVRRVARLLERVDDAALILAGHDLDGLPGGKPIGRAADAVRAFGDRLDGGVVYSHEYRWAGGDIGFSLPRVEFRHSTTEYAERPTLPVSAYCYRCRRWHGCRAGCPRGATLDVERQRYDEPPDPLADLTQEVATGHIKAGLEQSAALDQRGERYGVRRS